MWVNDGGVRFFRSGRGHVWVSLAMSEPGPSFVIVLDCTLSLILLVSLFLSMLVIRDFCSSLPQPVQKQLSALKYGIDLVLSCCVKFFNGKWPCISFGELWCTNPGCGCWWVHVSFPRFSGQCCKPRERFPGALGDGKCRVAGVASLLN